MQAHRAGHCIAVAQRQDEVALGISIGNDHNTQGTGPGGLYGLFSDVRHYFDVFAEGVQFGQVFFEIVGVPVEFGERFRVLFFFEEFGEFNEVGAFLVGLFPRLDLEAQLFHLFQDLLGGVLVAPEFRRAGLAFEFFEFYAFAGEVKDSAGRRRSAPGAWRVVFLCRST